ncbi:MAG: hydrogenase iron-sulfur subunit [Nitrososphaerales archaeon]
MSSEEPRIGVFICHCGGNISDVVDVEKVREAASKMPGVVVAETNRYMCSKTGLDLIKDSIKKYGLNRVVEASCTPRMHLNTFRRALVDTGLNPYLLDMVNIREHCSWVHTDKDTATEKAIAIVRGSVMRTHHLEPLQPEYRPVERSVMVVGGGVSGIFASLELANKGYQVYLVDRKPSIGGRMMQLSKTFPTLDCSTCILAPRMVEVGQHPNVKIITLAEPVKVSGSPGNYDVTLRIKPRYVDVSNCASCGDCAKKCPMKRVPNEHEAGLAYRTAIYLPFPQAIPQAYVIDPEHCLYFQKGTCKVCAKACTRGAINFDDKERLETIRVGAIVLATGIDVMDPSPLKEYSYGQHPDIVTNLQFERLLLQGMLRPSDKNVPKKVAFILCVGSRSPERAQAYCSKVCCMIALKQAFLLKEFHAESEPWVFYTDMRAAGKWYEEFYTRCREHGVKFVRGRVAEVKPNGSSITLRAEDTLLGAQIEENFDLVVLSTALLPSIGTKEVGQLVGMDTGPDGFLLEKHYKLEPVDGAWTGVYAAGCALGPKDVRESVVEAMSAASRASTFLGGGKIEVSPEKAFVIEDLCDGCGVCLQYCPKNALSISNGKATINPVSCIGCGICVPACPKQAIDLKNNTEKQLLASIYGVSQGNLKPLIVAFTEKVVGYRAADMYGLDRRKYPPNIVIIEVPTTRRVGLKHVLHAFNAGADGVVFVEAEDNWYGLSKEDGLKQFRGHVSQIQRELRKFGVDAARVMAVAVTLPQYYKLEIFDTVVNRVKGAKPLTDDAKAKIKGVLSS